MVNLNCLRKMRGVFWIVEGELKVFPYEEGSIYGVSKSGDNYNHRVLWTAVKPVGCRKPFDYYPRGRVEYKKNGSPIIYLNPNIGEDYILQIRNAFNLTEDPIIRYDYSEHYKCYLDR